MKNEYLEARKHTQDALAKLKIEHHMFHEPSTDSYWDQDIKLLVINLESIGYKDCGHFNVDRKELSSWMYHPEHPTCRNTVAASKVLLDGFYKRKEPTRQALHDSYYNKSGLEKTLDRICYYNIRPVSNDKISEDWSRGDSDFRGDIAECIKQEIIALDADIIMVSGRQATDAISKLLCPDNPLPYLEERMFGSCKIISVRHFSRPSYTPLSESLCKAVHHLIKNKTLNN